MSGIMTNPPNCKMANVPLQSSHNQICELFTTFLKVCMYMHIYGYLCACVHTCRYQKTTFQESFLSSLCVLRQSGSPFCHCTMYFNSQSILQSIWVLEIELGSSGLCDKQLSPHSYRSHPLTSFDGPLQMEDPSRSYISYLIFLDCSDCLIK